MHYFSFLPKFLSHVIFGLFLPNYYYYSQNFIERSISIQLVPYLTYRSEQNNKKTLLTCLKILSENALLK